MSLELAVNNFVEMNSDELLTVDGGDFYDGFMKVCEYAFKGGVITIAQTVIPVPVLGAAVGKYAGDAAWDAAFK